MSQLKPASWSYAEEFVPEPEVVEQHSARVYRLAYRLTGNVHDAEDLTQDVFVRVYRNLHRYQPGTFDGWLYRITLNLFLHVIRRRRRYRTEPLPEQEWRVPATDEPGPADVVERRTLEARLEQGLVRLSPDFRLAVVLCDIEGMTYDEIADTTGWPIGTVRSRIHRGRKQLREHLAAGDRERDAAARPRRRARDRGAGA